MNRTIRAGLAGVLAGAMALSGCGDTDEVGVTDIYDTSSSTPVSVYDGKAVVFVIDNSGSMGNRLNGERKIDIAKRSLIGILSSYQAYAEKNPDTQVGLYCFSGNSVVALSPMAKFDYSSLVEKIKGLEANAGTPLGISLAYGERELDKTGYAQTHVVLLTDGQNEAGREPSDVLESIIKTNLAEGDSPTNVNVIALNTDSDYFTPMQKLGAAIYSADSSQQLEEVLKENTKMILEAPDPTAISPR